MKKTPYEISYSSSIVKKMATLHPSVNHFVLGCCFLCFSHKNETVSRPIYVRCLSLPGRKERETREVQLLMQNPNHSRGRCGGGWCETRTGIKVNKCFFSNFSLPVSVSHLTAHRTDNEKKNKHFVPYGTF